MVHFCNVPLGGIHTPEVELLFFWKVIYGWKNLPTLVWFRLGLHGHFTVRLEGCKDCEHDCATHNVMTYFPGSILMLVACNCNLVAPCQQFSSHKSLIAHDLQTNCALKLLCNFDAHFNKPTVASEIGWSTWWQWLLVGFSTSKSGKTFILSLFFKPFLLYTEKFQFFQQLFRSM